MRQRERESLNHLSAHQWVGSAIHTSPQLTSPVSFIETSTTAFCGTTCAMIFIRGLGDLKRWVYKIPASKRPARRLFAIFEDLGQVKNPYHVSRENLGISRQKVCLQISAENTCTKPLYDYINFKFSKIGQGNKYLKNELMKNMEQQKRKQMDRQNQYIQSKTNKNRKNI